MFPSAASSISVAEGRAAVRNGTRHAGRTLARLVTQRDESERIRPSSNRLRGFILAEVRRVSARDETFCTCAASARTLQPIRAAAHTVGSGRWSRPTAWCNCRL